MQKIYATNLTFLILFLITTVNAQTVKVDGYISEAASGEPLRDVAIQVGTTGVLSNEYGYFSLVLAAQKEVCLSISHVGYEKHTQCFRFQQDSSLNIALTGVQLQEVEVSSGRIYKQTAWQAPGKLNVAADELAQLAYPGGEQDILKYLSLQPGVGGGYEGFSQISVRGGGLFENQFYLDGVPVYNTGHFLGLTSVFNSRVIQSADLYKGYTPGRYGGRLSSAMDIQLKEGNRKEINIEADIGPLDADLLLEGPLDKAGKTTLLLAGRAFYIFPLVNAIRQKNSKDEDFLNYSFYDLNLKFSHQFSPSNRFFVSWYRGSDIIYLKDLIRNSGGETFRDDNRQNIYNSVLSARWHLRLSSDLFLKTTLGYTSTGQDYLFVDERTFPEVNGDIGFDRTDTDFSSSLQDYYFHSSVDYFVHNKLSLKGGIEVVLHQLSPAREYKQLSNSFSGSDGAINTYDLGTFQRTEASAYLEGSYRFSSRWRMNTAIRHSAFFGADKTQHVLQPRLALFYEGDGFSIKGSANRMYQFLHPFLQGSSDLQPTVIWLPSTTFLSAQHSWQYSLGAYRTHASGRYSFSAELFYRHSQDLSRFEGGSYAQQQDLRNWQQQARTDGSGEAYGAEWYAEGVLKKNVRLSLAYTWMRSTRQFSELNEGQAFPFKFGREHALTASVSCKLSERWAVAANFVLNSNQQLSFPTSYMNSSLLFNRYYVYDEINNASLPLYHRLDLGFTWQKELSDGHDYGFRMGLYNAYSRKNVATAYPYYGIQTNGNTSREVLQIKGKYATSVLPYINVFIKRRFAR